MKCELHPYQDYSVNWIIQHNYCGLLLDMGLGKTLSTLTALDYLYTFNDIKKVLVIAPLSVARQTWSDEIEKWDHLKHLTYSKILGSKKQRVDALNKQADIYLINLENVSWLVEYYGRRWPFDTVVLDELSSFKDASSKRFKALRKVRPLLKRVIGLTGTPAPNSLIDLWPQLYLIDRGERLGSTITSYRRNYFYPAQTNGFMVYKYELLKGAKEMIYDKISDVCVSMKAKDYLDLPDKTDSILNIELSDTHRKVYKQFEREYVMSLDESELVASNAAVLSGKLLQMANGAIYDDDRCVHEIHTEKLDMLQRIVDDAQGQPILVFYNFEHDLNRIQQKFKQAKRLDVSAGDVARWNGGELPMLLCHPKSAGHGLNLQKGGHIIVWFGLTWSLELYQQANARLNRQGQTEPVIIHHLVAKGTIDEKVIQVLQGKEQAQEALLEAVKAKIKEYQKGV